MIDPKSKKNIVIFQPDQLRYDSLGCTGNPVCKTPNIDKFAKRGTLFSNCFVQASVCSQSRCSMFTGTYPHVSGHRSLENLIKPYEPNFFRTLKENGYHVAYLGPRGDTFAADVTELSVTEYGFLEEPTFMPKFTGNKDSKPTDDIWQRMFYKGRVPPEEAMDYDEAVVRSAVAWLDTKPPEPFCLFMPLLYPHCPWAVEEPYFSMYDRASIPPSVPLSSKTGYEPMHMAALRDAMGTGRATPEMWAEIKAVYYGMISRVDAQFGRVLDAIDEHGFTDSTYVAFFTDHGEWMGDYGLIEKWPSGLSESLVREPLILAGPDIPANEVNDSLCEMVDFMPTMFELNGIPEHFPHNGRSMVSMVQNKLDHFRDFAFSEGGFLKSEEPLLEHAPFPYDRKAGLQHEQTELVGKAISMRNKDYAYIYRLYEHAELYDRKADPGEAHNLAGLPDYAHIESMFREALLKWMVAESDFLPWQKDDRFPKVHLESPKSQAARRIASSASASVSSGVKNGVNGVNGVNGKGVSGINGINGPSH